VPDALEVLGIPCKLMKLIIVLVRRSFKQHRWLRSLVFGGKLLLR